MFTERLAYYFGEVNAIHPFRDGNGPGPDAEDARRTRPGTPDA
jgi:hypothetical protein